MPKAKEKVTKLELFSLSKARYEAKQDLNNHLERTDGSELLTARYRENIRSLTEEIADKLELWLGIS